MRKHIPLVLLAMIAISLLLVGCVGGGTLPLPNPNPPIETDPEKVFDGSPTHLSLEFERSPIGVQALTQNQEADEPEVAYVRITRKEGHHQVYSVVREIQLNSSERTFTLDSELPAQQGYETQAIVVRGSEFIEFGFAEKIDTPAKNLTTTTVPMGVPTYSLTIPDQMYSGGSLTQVKIDTPNELTFARVLIGVNPWQSFNGTRGLWSANPDGINPTGWVIEGSRGGTLPEFTKPTKLYYQIAVGPRGDLFPRDEIPWPYEYEPNVEQGEELPYIWVYPYPGWIDE